MSSSPKFQFAAPDAALDALVAELAPVGSETVGHECCAGRVLAQPIRSDRASPPGDVSAMDGYALRLADFRGSIEVAGEIAIGRPPPPLPPGMALRIVTGAPVPPEADAVVQRERVVERPDRITLREGCALPPAGASIRRRGENLAAGDVVIDAGAPLTPAIVSAVASFGVGSPVVRRHVRVAIIITGDELRPIGASCSEFEIRDSNGPTLSALLDAHAWIQRVSCVRVADEPASQQAALVAALESADAVVLTGGVSMGDRDFVPGVIREAGGRVIFHKIPVRPGNPLLGAVGPGGQAILALPGNPLSSAVTLRRFGLRALRRLAGFSHDVETPPLVEFVRDNGKTLHFWWYRLVRMVRPGRAEIVVTRGSGDVVSLARSDGFIEIPPNEPCCGPRPFYAWSTCT